MSKSPLRPQRQQVLDFARTESVPRLPGLPQAVYHETRDLLVRMLVEVVRAEPEEGSEP
jgi:hypothetical protein